MEEKESRARETMCIMGLQPWALSAAWAATYAAILSIVSLAVAIVSKASFLPRTDFRWDETLYDSIQLLGRRSLGGVALALT